jgi:thiol-disulfide isomerase/thioredoxin
MRQPMMQTGQSPTDWYARMIPPDCGLTNVFSSQILWPLLPGSRLAASPRHINEINHIPGHPAYTLTDQGFAMRFPSLSAVCVPGLLLLAALAPSLRGALPATRPAVDPLRAVDVEGVSHCLATAPDVKATAVIFLSTQCPISNKYIPELNRLAESHAGDGVRIFAVLSDPSLSRDAARQYVKEFQITFTVLFDDSGELAAHLHPTVTPEAFALDRAGIVQYHGRIDDLWADLRKQKVTATTHDLTDALAAISAGTTPSVSHTTPIGCFFEAWNTPTSRAATTRPTRP